MNFRRHSFDSTQFPVALYDTKCRPSLYKKEKKCTLSFLLSPLFPSECNTWVHLVSLMVLRPMEFPTLGCGQEMGTNLQ